MAKLFSGDIRYLLWVFLFLFVFGLVLGNVGLVFGSLFPLFFVVVSSLVSGPMDIEVRRELSEDSVCVGDEVVVEADVCVGEGFGFVSVFDELPGSFELVGGNNFHLFFKGFGEESFSFSYRVCCPERGVFELPKTQVGAYPFVPVLDLVKKRVGGDLELRVRSPKLSLQDMRGGKDFAGLSFPKSDLSKIGVSTTDFREVREYEYGDPLNRINWKATAKNVGNQPLVNEYEKEGEKVVWFFLDASSDLLVGNSLENGFECALRATDTLAHYFVDKRYMVGLYVFNDEEKLFYPERGRQQYLKITKELMDLEPSDREEGLRNGVERCRGFISRYNPLCFIVTDLSQKPKKSFKDGLKKLRALVGEVERDVAPIVVLNIKSGSMQPLDQIKKRNGYGYLRNAVDIKEFEQRELKECVVSLGGEVIDWDPVDEDFTEPFLKHRGRRQRQR